MNQAGLPESRFRGKARLGGRDVVLETGRIARQANGAVLVRAGDTVVLVTAVAAAEPRAGTDFFPLTVEYRERLSAAGRFPGGYRKREGRTSDREILSCRLIDRTIRPLFPEGFRSEVQILATVLAYEPGSDPETLSILGAAAALEVSDIPFAGPVAGIRVAKNTAGEWFVFPETAPPESDLELDLVLSLGRDGLVMMEGEAREATEADLVEAIRKAREAAGPLHALLEEARAACGKPKREFSAPAPDPVLAAAVREIALAPMQAALRIAGKQERALAVENAVRESMQRLSERFGNERAKEPVESDESGSGRAEPGEPRSEARGAAVLKDLKDRATEMLHGLESEILRRNVLEENLRADGRAPDAIRPIDCEAGLLPRVHGSALFTRGETQALVVATLGTGQDEQEVESVAGIARERFQLFYNFPSYAVGEVRPIRGPGRREIGHGNLARRALEAVLPPPDRFPYTIKIESEITESNGSSSMATVCGGCLALMDAGIPILRPVAGIAMGLIQEGGKAVVLSDILGVEDHLGDMDFKVAGTIEGITAVQLDNKVGSLPLDLLESALEQARRGRLHILEEMRKALAEPRSDLSTLAPRIAVIQIRPHRIRDLIGPGGRHIQDLQHDTGTKVEVDDTGRVRIYAFDAAALQHARRRVHDLTGEPRVGSVYRGTVTGVKDFGYFVRLFQGIEGLVHVSEAGDGTGSCVSEGDPVIVKVLGVEQGKIQLSRRAALGATEAEIENG